MFPQSRGKSFWGSVCHAREVALAIKWNFLRQHFRVKIENVGEDEGRSKASPINDRYYSTHYSIIQFIL